MVVAQRRWRERCVCREMASEAPPPKRRGLGRGPNHIPKAPTNPDERTLIEIRPGPNSTDFGDHRIVKCISQLCLQNWPTPAITWATTPAAHKDAVWAEFQKRYRWADEQGPAISTLFWQKCAARTKDNLNKEREKALHNAGIDHPGNAASYMHEYSPWWCDGGIWGQMCDQWRDENWVKKRRTASDNRLGGAPSGEKAKGTYKGGSISQLQHITYKSRYSAILECGGADLILKTKLTELIEWSLQKTTDEAHKPKKTNHWLLWYSYKHIVPNLAHCFREGTGASAGSSSSGSNRPSTIPDQLFV